MTGRIQLDSIEQVALPDGPIGLLSDAHGDDRMATLGVAALVDRGARSLLYLGDVCGDGVVGALAGVTDGDGNGVPARLVFGNMDFDPRAMGRYAESIGVGVDHPVGSLRCCGAVLVTTHGHFPGIEEAAIAMGADYFIHGHTHTVRDERVGATRILNPGALHRASRYTVAVLDISADRFEVIEVPKGR